MFFILFEKVVGKNEALFQDKTVIDIVLPQPTTTTPPKKKKYYFKILFKKVISVKTYKFYVKNPQTQLFPTMPQQSPVSAHDRLSFNRCIDLNSDIWHWSFDDVFGHLLEIILCHPLGGQFLQYSVQECWVWVTKAKIKKNVVLLIFIFTKHLN